MDAEQLRETHARLHAELAGARQIDPESRRILGEIMQDISRLIDAPPGAAPAAATTPPADPGTAAGAGAGARLETLAVQFEAVHPALAANIRRLVDLLSKAGI